MINNIEKIIKKGDYLYCIVRNHPNRTANDYVLHHRAVVENDIGRYLTDDEEVHHINEDEKHNNDLSNLELMTKEQHRLLHSIAMKKPLINVVCPQCGAVHQIKPNIYRYLIKQGRVNFFCSRSCNGKYNGVANKKGMPLV